MPGTRQNPGARIGLSLFHVGEEPPLLKHAPQWMLPLEAREDRAQDNLECRSMQEHYGVAQVGKEGREKKKKVSDCARFESFLTFLCS